MKNDAFWTWFDERARPKLAARAETFALIFEHLDQFDRPVTIVETGCVRRVDDWSGAGYSTVLFAKYVDLCGGTVESVDINPEATAVCRRLVDSDSLSIETGDSVSFLKWRAHKLRAPTSYPTIDLLYLDSLDFVLHDPLPSAIHHHAELMAAMPMIRDDTLVVVDDSPVFFDDNQRAEIGGKGFLVARHMHLAGAELHFCRYHSGWTKVGPAKAPADVDLKDLVARARGHVEADRSMQAEQLYRLILGITTPPATFNAAIAHGEACAFYAKVAMLKQRFGAAADWYREAIKADPLATDYRLKLARDCLLPIGALGAALTEAERATRIDPEEPDPWHILGGIAHEMGNVKQCVKAYDQQLALDPDDPSSLLDRCVIALDTSDYDLAERLCLRVMGTPREPDAWHCLAMMAARQHRHEEAIEMAKKALEAGCRDQPTTYWNMSISLHAIGRYREGWEAHERREGAKANPVLSLPMGRFTRPRWAGEGPVKEDGTPLKIHVHCEAGAGDNLVLARYLPLLKEKGYDVRYEAMESMVGLIKTSFPGLTVCPRSVDYPGSLTIDRNVNLRDFDVHSPIGSIPAVLGTDIDTVPQNVPYLKADPDLVEHYDRVLRSQFGDRKRVGLCWSSGIRDGVWMKEYGTRKSMHFEALAPILGAGYNARGTMPLFVSLQVGPERAQNDEEFVVDVLPESPSWEETAALVANLDLVISVDTATAHLAGGMGKPLWVMCQRDAASWHFLCWREGASWNERNPWYPSARIFRQHTFDQPHEWSDVVVDVAAELKRWAAKKQAAPATA
jgi:tetratricopeptide (TPR) repeat protein